MFAYPTEVNTTIKIYLDTDWFSPRDVCELSDNKTLVYFYTDKLPEQTETGVYEYLAKIVTNTKEDFINPDLLKADMNNDISVMYNMFEEGSETAYEKYTFNEQARNFMTIMRLKWSITGTAEAMKSNTNIWVEHNGVKMWTTHAEMQMLKRWAAYRENNIFIR